MLQVFLNNKNSIQYGTTKFVEFDYIRNRLLQELERIQDYYYNKNNAVNNNHILNRIITNNYYGREIDPFDLFVRIDSSRGAIERQFKLVSNVSEGEILDNVLYKSNSREILVSVTNNIDPYMFPKYWKEFTPVRLSYTNNTELDFYPNDGTKTPVLNKTSVIEIDLSILILMYNYWSLERDRLDMSTNPNVFIRTIVLPKLMGSYTDLTLFNIFKANFYNTSLNIDSKYKHPFHVLDFDNQINFLHKKLIKKVHNVSMDIDNLFNYIPTIYNTNMNNALTMNMLNYTRQSEWVIWYARIEYIEFILDLLSKRGYERNRTEISKLKYYITRLENGSTTLKHLNDTENKSFVDRLTRLKSLIGMK